MIRWLAITPPRAPYHLIDAADVWLAQGLSLDEGAVLLRRPDMPPSEVLAQQWTSLEVLARQGLKIQLSGAVSELDPASDPHWPSWLGIQLRGDPTPESTASLRATLPTALLGASCHGEPRPTDPSLDYVCFAPVFAPRTASDAFVKSAVGLERLRAWIRSQQIPVLALGGITPSTAKACIDAGAAGIASISLFFGPPARVASETKALARILQTK